MALLDFLREKKNEIQIGSHPLEKETDEFKYLYCFGLATSFCQNEQVYREVKSIFENIIDLLGLHENYKFRIIEDVEKDFDYRIYDVFKIINTKEKKYCFLVDMIRMEAKTLWGQSYFKEIMSIYIEIFKINKEEIQFLEKFWKSSKGQEMEKAISLYNEFERNGNYISFKVLSYMYPSIALKDKYEDLVIEAGEKLVMDKPTIVKGTLQVKNGGILLIKGAKVSLYGKVFVDGGRLDIRKACIEVKECEENYAIEIINSAVVSIEDTKIFGNSQCGFIKQNCGHLIIRNSILKDSGKVRAISFSGRNIFLIQTQLENCQDGAVDNLESSRMSVKRCQFINCVAEHGGAIHSVSLEDVRVHQCIFKQCKAKFLGSAIYFSYKKYGQSVTDCVLEECEPEETIIYNSYMP